MAENNITLYIGTAERKERLHDVAKKRGYPSTSAMVQALADGEAVPVRKQQIEQIRANFLPIYSYILGLDADMSLIEMLENVADDLADLIANAN